MTPIEQAARHEANVIYGGDEHEGDIALVLKSAQRIVQAYLDASEPLYREVTESDKEWTSLKVERKYVMEVDSL